MQNPSTVLAKMRDQAPLVQNITNYVAMNVMANVMLAAGASPAMVHAAEEGGEFATIAQALTVNIGTLDPAWVDAMLIAAKTMDEQGKPWVLDPVAVGATELRCGAGARLMALRPTVVRGNASEIMALVGANAAGKGVDSADPVTMAEGAARQLASATGAVVAVTGEVDFVTDGSSACRIANGDPIMPHVTALGCALTGVVGAFCAVAPAYDATVAALAYYAVAGERAGKVATGPGSFQVAFLDALHGLTESDLDADARITHL